MKKTPPKTEKPWNEGRTLVDHLAPRFPDKAGLERHLAQAGLGIIDALESGRMKPEQAWNDLFNVDNFLAIRRRRLGPEIREFFSWGLEIEDVAKHVPHALAEHYIQMRKRGRRAIAQSFLPRRRTLRKAG